MKVWTALLALLALAAPVPSAEMDKAKLRQLAKLSQPDGFVLRLGFSGSRGFLFAGEQPDPPSVEIARIRKELKGDASDAERYFRIAVLNEKAKRKKDADEAAARAIALYRQQVKEHPHDMRRLAQLGDALFFNGETKEGEALLRRAVKEAPNDWRVWGLLGKCLDNQASWAILGRQYYDFHFSWEESMHPAFFDKKPKAKQIAEWRRLQKEARRCFDRAIELAPRETEPHFWRTGSLYFHGIIEGGLRNAQGEQVPMWNAFLTSACTEDTRQIARLSPNDPKSVGGAVVVELLICMAKAQTKSNESIGLFAEPLPELSLDFVRWGTHRLEELTKSADKSTAAAASEILAYVLMARIAADGMGIAARMDNSEESEAKSNSTEKSQPKFKEALSGIATGLKMMACLGQIEGNLRRAVQLDPTRELAWEMLSALFYESGRTAEAITLCEQRIKVKDNAHNRFTLAYGYAEQRQFDKAIEQLRVGIKYDENNLSYRLGLVAALLQRGAGDDLKQAREQLDALASHIKMAKKKSRIAEYHLLRGLHAALSAQPNQAKEQFQTALRQDMDNRTVIEALIALGIPITPGDESLAIAYLQAHKAEIRRRSKRPEAPVAKVSSTEDNLADEDLFFLSAFSQLRDLQLSSASITDAGLAYLESLSTLQHLQLNCAEITDAGLAHLRKLKRLKSVNLRGTKVTDKGIAELRKDFPKLDISR